MTFATNTQLKTLKKRRKELDIKLRSAKHEEREASKIAEDLTRRLNSVERQIENLEAEKYDVAVTDHAIVQYINRVLGMDLDEIKQQIVTDQVRGQIKQLRSGEFPVGKTHKVRVKNMSVVTVVVPKTQTVGVSR